MDLIEKIKKQAQKQPKRIVFPESEDERVLKAIEFLQKEQIVHPIIVGDEEKIRKLASEINCNLGDTEFVESSTYPKLDKYIANYCESRNTKERIAKRLMRRSLYFGAAMLRNGDCDGMVGGVASLTATVVKAGHIVVGLADGFSAPSSSFIMCVPDCPYGENGNFIYADAGVNANPSVEELAEIAVASANTASSLGWTPRVAMLSYATKGSAAGPLVDKVSEATEIAKEKASELLIDGEFQVDTAIVPDVAKRKLKDEESDVAGKANVLIFPDLNAGNIAYKLTERLAKAEAYGPLLQGFGKPVNDMSRGASVDDIVGVTAITVVQAQKE